MPGVLAPPWKGSRWNGLCLCVKRARRKCATVGGRKDKTISEEEKERGDRAERVGGGEEGMKWKIAQVFQKNLSSVRSWLPRVRSPQ